MKDKVAVIGGSGFIGSVTCKLLSEEGTSDFLIIDKNPSKAFPGKHVIANILDQDKLDVALEGSNTVINLAAEHADDVSPVSLYYDVNVQGAKNVCRAAVKNGVKKIIFTSSVAVYGLNKPNPNEEYPTDPFNHYGKSKLQAEEVYLAWYNEDPESRSLVIIRPTVVFGEGNRGNVYNLLKQIASGRFLKIGPGHNVKSMAYVQNVASFINFSIKRFNHQTATFNYADKPDLSMNELLGVCQASLNVKILNVRIPYWIGLSGGAVLDIVAKITGKKFPISTVRIKKFCATTQFDSSKLLSSEFQPPFTLEKGLKSTLKSEFR